MVYELKRQSAGGGNGYVTEFKIVPAPNKHANFVIYQNVSLRLETTEKNGNPVIQNKSFCEAWQYHHRNKNQDSFIVPKVKRKKTCGVFFVETEAWIEDGTVKEMFKVNGHEWAGTQPSVPELLEVPLGAHVLHRTMKISWDNTNTSKGNENKQMTNGKDLKIRDISVSHDKKKMRASTGMHGPSSSASSASSAICSDVGLKMPWK